MTQDETIEQPVQTTVYANDWRWNNQAPPPISGQVRTDTRDWVTATHVFISNTTDAGVDVGSIVQHIVGGSNLDLTHRTDPTRNVRYKVMATPAARSGYVDVAVSYVQSAGSLPTSGTVCTLSMTVPTAALVITVSFVQMSPTNWVGTGSCPHGKVSTTTYLAAPGPLDYRAMVETVQRQHHLLVGCTCPPAPSQLNATVTFQVPTGVTSGQQRYVPQQSASIIRNFFYGPGLTCAWSGVYQVQSKVQLSGAVSAGAGGLGVIVISGQPVHSVPMIDEAGKATATISTLINLVVNQSVNLGYENTSKATQDVALATLTVSEVWVP